MATLANSALAYSLPKIHELEQPRGVNMKRTAAIILGGGQGTRLFPLTLWRCKPAICFGGRYRLIDVPISNAINSGCQKIYVITQFLSSTLHQHLFNTYRFDGFNRGFIELLPAEERFTEQTWFQGTADAVRKNLEYFIDTPADYFFILSGDQLYHMDFSKMLAQALATDADLTLAAMPVFDRDAKRMGIIKADDLGYVTGFHEKPQKKSELDQLRINPSFYSANEGKNLLGSLGIYLFKREYLLTLLKEAEGDDFGKHLIPKLVQKGRISTYLHDSYWEDIGTIRSFYEANLALTLPNPPFDLYDEEKPLYCSQNHLPGPKIHGTHVKDSILSEGVILEGEEVANSVLGPRARVGKGSVIQNSYVMGHDFYQSEIRSERLPEKLSIGDNCLIRKTIVDKHASIGNNVQLINKDNLDFYDGKQAYIRDGIIVIPRGANLPDGFIL